MEKLNTILHELGISKVNLAKYLGVSRQMIYNYLELDDISKWPKDKKVLLLNLLGVKAAEDINSIKVTTDYIKEVEDRIKALLESSANVDYSDNNNLFQGLDKKEKELLSNIIDLIKLKFEGESKEDAYHSMKYLYNFVQAMESSKEIKYILAYVSKSIGMTKPTEFVFNQDEQYVFESILFSAINLYGAKGYSPAKIAEARKRFIDKIEQRQEEKLGRTLELNVARVQALKELGYTEVTDKNLQEVLAKIVEIQSRKV